MKYLQRPYYDTPPPPLSSRGTVRIPVRPYGYYFLKKIWKRLSIKEPQTMLQNKETTVQI